MNLCNCGCFKTGLRIIFYMLLSIITATVVTFSMNAGYWGAHGWHVIRAMNSIFGPDRYSKDSMAGMLVLRAWAKAGYPEELTVIDIPEKDIGRYQGKIIYEYKDKNGNTVRETDWFHIRWDYSDVAENPMPITDMNGNETWDIPEEAPPQLEWYGDEPEEWYQSDEATNP
jgi:hypothetical protein